MAYSIMILFGGTDYGMPNNFNDERTESDFDPHSEWRGFWMLKNSLESVVYRIKKIMQNGLKSVLSQSLSQGNFSCWKYLDIDISQQ